MLKYRGACSQIHTRAHTDIKGSEVTQRSIENKERKWGPHRNWEIDNDREIHYTDQKRVVHFVNSQITW